MTKHNTVAIQPKPRIGDVHHDTLLNEDFCFDGVAWEPIDPGYQELSERLDRIETMIGAIAERLALLDEPSPKDLEKHKMLREAYEKYKFTEALCKEKNDD